MLDRLLALLVLAIVLGIPLGLIFLLTGQFLMDFVFFYPLFMSGLWIAGGLYFWLHWERHWPWNEDTLPPPLAGEPLISILIPCFNEGDNVRETIHAALSQQYPNIEVIAINDGSKDDTGAILDALAVQDPRLRVLHLAENQGKAVALRMGAIAARSEYLVCIDGDALLAPHTAAYLVAPLLENPRLGAVTGNPRIRTRSTLVGRVQVGEFSSIIGLIKRTQRVFGRIFTVSGVVVAFRRTALHRVGYWSTDMITEDIDISWKLQLDHWSIFYEPRALCWILMPETLGGLWKQRLRWAQGGAEVLFKNIRGIWQYRHRYLWPLLFEYCLSTGWAFTFLLSIILWLVGLYIALPEVICGAPYVATGVYRLAAGSGLPGAVRGQPADRSPLRKRFGQDDVLGDLVPAGVLVGQSAHHTGQFSQSAVPFTSETCALGQSRSRHSAARCR